MRSLIPLLASYNEWMNGKLYEAASGLSADDLAADRGAYFGSVLGTLNHLVVADRIWLRRFAEHPAQPRSLDVVRNLPRPKSLDEILFADFHQLAEHRRMLDGVIRTWAESLSDADLACVLRYANTKGVVATKRFSGLVLHFFNHQTHHRGQVTTLLSQLGKDVGITDLLALIGNEEDA
jgi:uncharacterized damage-inducible protein DinB